MPKEVMQELMKVSYPASPIRANCRATTAMMVSSGTMSEWYPMPVQELWSGSSSTSRPRSLRSISRKSFSLPGKKFWRMQLRA